LRPAILVANDLLGDRQLPAVQRPNILKPLSPDTNQHLLHAEYVRLQPVLAGQEYNYSATVAIVMGFITVVIAYAVQVAARRNGV